MVSSSRAKGCAPGSTPEATCTCMSRQSLELIARLTKIQTKESEPLCKMFNRIAKHYGTRDVRLWPGKAGELGRKYRRPQKDALNSYLLTTRDICRLLKQYEKAYPDFLSLGAVPIDFCNENPDVCGLSLKRDMIDSGKTRAAVVINTHPIRKSGEHWLLVWIDLSRPVIAFLDSEGQAPPHRILSFVNRIRKECSLIHGSTCAPTAVQVRHQAPKTNECGIYCIYFVESLLQGVPVEEFFKGGTHVTNARMRMFFHDELFPKKTGMRSQGIRKSCITHTTPTQLQQLKNRGANLVVLFYAPWCDHCTKFKPAYERFAKSKRKGNKVRVCAFNMEEYPDVPNGFPPIQGFPTVVFCKSGYHEIYSGERTSDALIQVARQFFSSATGGDVSTLSCWHHALRIARARGMTGVCRKGNALHTEARRIYSRLIQRKN